VDINKELKEDEINVMARGYQKFFNVGEPHGFSTRDIRELAYPLLAFEKANGYLGLLTVDNRNPENPEWLFTSKSTTGGTFAGVFKGMIKTKLTQELMQKIISEKVTLVFEVIEPAFDPHIEEYTRPELVLLDVIKNDINFEKVPYEELDKFLELFMNKEIGTLLRKKKLIKVCENFNDYWQIVSEYDSISLLSENGPEGLVFEDSADPQNMFKIKTKWYSFWKFMRTVKIRITQRVKKNKERTGCAILEKSDSISMKENLHRAEDFKIFTFMVQLAEENLEEFEKMSIIEVRKRYHQTH
jgi:tRNA splicing ligase